MSMRKAETIRKELREIIAQGNEKEIEKLFDEILQISKEEFREDNYYTLSSYLVEKMVDSIIRNNKAATTQGIKSTLMKGLVNTIISRIMHGPWKN